MIHSRIPSAIAIAALASLSFHSATAQVVFSESFEAPVVTGFVSNTVPSGNRWVGATNGFGATTRGLYNERSQWPATPPFSTPFGEQAYFLNYVNSGLTTAVGATGQTLTAGVNYQVTFHAAAATGYTSANYRVELVAFGAADDNVARRIANATRPGTVLAFSAGSVTTNDMSSRFTINFKADSANSHLGKDLGIRMMYVGSGSTTSCLYDNVRLITGHDLNPSPANGQSLSAAGNVTLSWTNRPPVAPATTTPVDVWFGSNPAALTQVVDGQLTSSTVVSATTAGTWYWRVDSYPDGNPNGTPVIGQVFSFTIADTDGDGIPDTWEYQFFGSPTAANPSLDTDADGLTNLQEFTRGTNPIIADTDSDGLLDGVETATGTWVNATSTGTHPLIADTDKDGFVDGVETNTGTWVSITNTGTNPLDPDWDKDGLLDGAETNTGIYVDRLNAGSNPYLADTDGDGAGDWYEANATFTNPSSAAETSPIPYPLPKPDGSAGATNKPVKVYIVMGQSNATGIGAVNGTLPGTLETIAKREHRFPNLVDASNNWLPRNDVLYRRVASPATPAGPLAPGQGGSTSQLGPELGFGQVMGWYHDEPVLILKASQGNRSLGGDFLPPGSPRREFNGSNIAGYGESPNFWPVGTIPVPTAWYAGRQYDISFHNLPDYAVPPASWAPGVTYARETLVGHNGEIYWCGSGHTSDASTEPGVGANWTTRWNNYDSAPEILANFATFYPQFAAQGYQIGGFVWWQGHFDQGTPNYAPFYQENLVNYINAVRAEFNAPNAPFVVATIGFGGEPLSTKSPGFQTVFNAQMAVQDLPQFAGNVKSVDMLKYWRTPAESPKNEDYHYNLNAETYMLVGDAAGRAMLEMTSETTPPSPNPPTFAIAPTAVNATTIGMVATTATDVSNPVQYYFENRTNSTNSGWILSTRWESTGLPTGLSHTFRFKAKDAQDNETEWSAEMSATPANDVTAPMPNPLSFAAPLTVLGENAIAMAATPASDINGVEYQFVCTAGGGPNSSWQSSLEFTATGLTPSTSYTYIVRARDSVGNTTTDSAPVSASTTAPDATAPTPSPMSFATPPTEQGISSITMTATLATDPSGVEYFFEAVDGGNSSGWQNSPTYTDTGLAPGTTYGYRVRARDRSPAQNPTDWSAVLTATTDVPDVTAPVISQLSPFNNATSVTVGENLIVTFNEDITVDTGSITIKNLTDGTQTVIDVTDTTQVITSGPFLTINPTADLSYAKTYAIQIDPTAITDRSDNPFAGITNDTTWTFSTLLAPPIIDGSWNVDSSGLWSLAGNWLSNPVNQIPGIEGSTVSLNNNITAARTVTIDGTSRVVGTLNIGDSDNSHYFTLTNSSNANLVFNNVGNGAVLNSTTTLATLTTVRDTISAPITLADNLAVSVAGTISTAGVPQAGFFAITGNIGESGGARSITKSGNGTLILTGNNTYSGGFILNAGTVQATLNSNDVNNSYTGIGTGTLTINGGTIGTRSAGGFTTTNDSVWKGNFALYRGQTGTATWNHLGDVTLDGNISIAHPNGTFNLNISGDIGETGGSRGLTINGSPLTLSGNNSYTGSTRLNTGVLNLNSATAIGTGTLELGNTTGSSAVTLNNSSASAVTLSTNNAQTWNQNFTFAGTSSLNMGTGAVTMNNNRSITITANTLAVGGIGQSGGTRSLTKLGAGTLVIQGSSSYTGATTISGGTLAITGATQATTAITFTAGSLGLDTGFPVTASSAAVNLTNGTIKTTGSTEAPSYTLLTAASITGDPVLAEEVPGYELEISPDGTQLLLVNIGGGSPYDTWAAQIADPNLRGREADADGDGFDNGQEFLFGTSPVASNGSLATNEKSGANLVIRWRERETGAAYTLQQSTALANDWGAASAATIENDGTASGGYQPRKATISIGSDKLFFRVRGVEN
jgi:autotransporter-associated beta strand protein